MKNSGFKSYPSGAGMCDVAAHQQPIVAVNTDWVQMHGSRAQRRRIDRELRRMAAAKIEKQTGRQAVTPKKLPPYAKEIDDARRKGMVPARGCLGHVAIGFEWRRNIVPDFPVVIVPPERSPAEFEWRFVAGLDIFIMHRDCDIPRLHDLCSALFFAKAHDVQTFNIDRICRGEPRAWLRLIPLWKKQPCPSPH